MIPQTELLVMIANELTYNPIKKMTSAERKIAEYLEGCELLVKVNGVYMDFYRRPEQSPAALKGHLDAAESATNG